MSGTLHVIPNGDLVDHKSEPDCVCGPTAELVPRGDGSIGWVIVHAALDGREHHEETS
jgi:hypothetical protein